MLSTKISLSIATFTLLLTSCIGTDLVDAPLGNDQSAVRLSETEIGLEIEQTFQLSATYWNFSGEEAPSNFVWTSDDINIAEVDENGFVRAIAAGQTNINATAEDGKIAATQVTVVVDANAVAQIEISGETTQLALEETAQLTARGFNLLGDELSNLIFTWSSNDETILTVDENGLVEAVGSGAAAIIATADGVNSLGYEINVRSGDRSGEFVGLTGHNVNGTASITSDGDDMIVQLGSDFQTQSGPGLHIYIATDPDGQDYVDLGTIISTSGAQTYLIPSNVNANIYQYVLVWCEPFSVNFGRADVGL